MPHMKIYVESCTKTLQKIFLTLKVKLESHILQIHDNIWLACYRLIKEAQKMCMFCTAGLMYMYNDFARASFCPLEAKMWVSENSTTPGIFQPSLRDFEVAVRVVAALRHCSFLVWADSRKPWSSKQLKLTTARIREISRLPKFYLTVHF